MEKGLQEETHKRREFLQGSDDPKTWYEMKDLTTKLFWETAYPYVIYSIFMVEQNGTFLGIRTHSGTEGIITEIFFDENWKFFIVIYMTMGIIYVQKAFTWIHCLPVIHIKHGLVKKDKVITNGQNKGNIPNPYHGIRFLLPGPSRPDHRLVRRSHPWTILANTTEELRHVSKNKPKINSCLHYFEHVVISCECNTYKETT